MAHVGPGPGGPPPLGPEGFSWTTWQADPTVVVGLAMLGAAYGVALVRRERLAPGAPLERGRAVSFAGALLLLLGTLTGPLHDLSDYYLFSAHMVQHLLLAFAMPPLLLYGIPPWMGRLLTRPAAVRTIGARLGRPSGAFFAFNFILVAWHLPPLYNLAMEVHPVHIVQHLMLMGASVLLWWPLQSPSADLPRAPYPVQLLYLFVAGLPMVVVSIFITMADRVLYPYYAAAPRVFAGLDAHADQHLGGLIMWIPGGLVFLLALSVVFFRWQAAGGDDVSLGGGLRPPSETSPQEGCAGEAGARSVVS